MKPYIIHKPLPDRENDKELWGNISYGNLMRYKDDLGRIKIQIGNYSDIFDVRWILRNIKPHLEVHNFPDNPMRMYCIKILKKTEEQKRLEKEEKSRQRLIEAMM